MKTITIRAVPFPGEQLPEVLRRNAVSTNAYAERFFAHPAFRTDRFPEELRIGIMPLSELGFNGGATLEEIAAALPERGLEPCPAETGVFLRIAWKEQEQSADAVLTGTHRAPDRAVTVFSRRLEADGAFPRGLYLRKVEGELWLRGYVCDDEYRWSGGDLFAFALC